MNARLELMNARRELAEKVVALAQKAGADESQVVVRRDENFEIDFSARRANLSRSYENLSINLTLFRGGKRGGRGAGGQAAPAEQEGGRWASAPAALEDRRTCRPRRH